MKSLLNIQKDLVIILFKNQEEWAVWLEKNFNISSGIWMKIARKGSNGKSVSYYDALETALCFGWIDGQKKAYDDIFWLQKFIPRKTKSIWSKINRGKAVELIKNGKMKQPGLDAVELAKKNGQWDSAYSSQRNAVLPDDL